MTKKTSCPPHEYRVSGKPFRSKVGSKVVSRDVWVNGGRARRIKKVKQDILGPYEQHWFCTKCEKETKSLAGARP